VLRRSVLRIGVEQNFREALADRFHGSDVSSCEWVRKR
jgi:hypothetical protein